MWQVSQPAPGEILFGNSTETQPAEAANTEVIDQHVNITQNEVDKTTAIENSESDKTSSDNNTSFIFDISDDPLILSRELFKTCLMLDVISFMKYIRSSLLSLNRVPSS